MKVFKNNSIFILAGGLLTIIKSVIINLKNYYLLLVIEGKFQTFSQLFNIIINHI